MKRLIKFLLAIIIISLSITAKAQETIPDSLGKPIPVNGQFFITIHNGDTAIWHFKGYPYGIEQLARHKDVGLTADIISYISAQVAGFPTLSGGNHFTGQNYFDGNTVYADQGVQAGFNSGTGFAKNEFFLPNLTINSNPGTLPGGNDNIWFDFNAYPTVPDYDLLYKHASPDHLWYGQLGSEKKILLAGDAYGAADTTTIRALPKYIELWAWMGQSLFQGKGDTSKSVKVTPNIAVQWNYGLFRTANDPIGPLADTLWQGSPIPAFNLQMYKLHPVQQCDISGALGSTSQTSIANTGAGTWDVSTSNNLTLRLIGRIDSCKAQLIAQGFTPVFRGIHYELSETDVNAIQAGTLTGAQWYTAFVNGIDTLKAHCGQNTPIYVTAIGTKSTGAAWGCDTIRNREYQAALAGYCIIVDNNLQNFPTWGLMNPNPYYANVHPSQEGNNFWGTNLAIGTYAAMPQITVLPSSSLIPSFAIPSSLKLTTTPTNGAFEHYKNNLFFNDGSITGATRYRVPLLPQNGIAPGALVFGGTNRGLATDTTYLRVEDDATPGYRAGATPFFSAHRTAVFTSVGTNSKIVLENYGTTPASGINFLSSRGTSNVAASPVQSGDIIGFMSAYTNYGTGAAAYGGTTGGINIVARENATSTSLGTGLDAFYTPNGGTTHQRGWYLSQNGGMYLTINSTGEPISIPTKLYVKPEMADSSAVVFDAGTIPALTLRNTTYYNYNKLNFSMPTNVGATMDATVGLNINTSNNKFVKIGSGPFTVGASTGVVHATAGLFSYSNVAYGDIQTGITNKLYGTGSGTTFSEIGLGSNFSFSGSTLNWIAPTIGTLPGRTIVADANYTQLATDYAIAYTTLTAPRTVTLIAIADKQTILVKDEAGTAATNNITINAPSGKTIDGTSSKIISTNNGFIKLYYQLSSGNYFTY